MSFYSGTSRYLLCIFFVVIICLAVILEVEGQQETIIVGIDQGYAPHEFLDPKTSEVRGFNVDIIKAISRMMGVTIEWRPMKWSEAYQSLKNGTIDCLSMATKEERKEYFDFSVSTLNLSLAIFVKESEVGLARLSDLAGRTVAVEKDDISHVELQEKVPEAIIVPVDNQSEGLKLLEQGEVTAFFGNLQTSVYYINTNKLHGIKIIGEKVEIAPRSIAVKKGDPLNILEKINESIRSLFKSGEYDEIYEKWFGSVFKYENNNDDLLWVLVGILGVMAIAGSVVATKNKMLQRKVEDSDKMIETLSAKIPYWILIIQKKTIKYSNFYYGGPSDLNKPLKEVLKRCFDEKEIEKIIDSFNKETFQMGLEKEEDNGNMKQYNITGSKTTLQQQPALLLIIEDVTEKKAYERLRENFIAMTNHELRTPLTVLRACTDFIAEDIESQTTKDLVKIMQRNVDRLQNLIENVTIYSKIVSDVFRISKSEIKFGEYKKNLKRIMEILYSKRQVIIETNGIDSEDLMFLDGEYLNQIIQNLVENAIKHSDPKTEVKIVFIRDIKDLVIKIEDKGAGIARKNLEEIFKPFVTIESEYSCTGTGLGLFIVKTIVTRMGGEIKVVSEKGKGSVFTIKFHDVFVQ